MKWKIAQLVVALALVQSTWAAYVVRYDFDDMVDGPIDGQEGWSVVSDTWKNPSAFSVEAGAGRLKEETDGALIVRASNVPIRCVTGDPVHWQKGESLKVEFDFRIVVDPRKLTENKPVMIFCLGNLLLDERARWEVRLDATPTGDWELSASLPDEASEGINAAKLLIRSEDVTVTSGWYRFVVEVIKRKDLVNSFSSRVGIYDKTGGKIASLRCTDLNKGKMTKAMWNLELVHVGFYSDKDIYGLSCIDNLTIVTRKWGNQLGF